MGLQQPRGGPRQIHGQQGPVTNLRNLSHGDPVTGRRFAFGVNGRFSARTGAPVSSPACSCFRQVRARPEAGAPSGMTRKQLPGGSQSRQAERLGLHIRLRRDFGVLVKTAPAAITSPAGSNLVPSGQTNTSDPPPSIPARPPTQWATVSRCAVACTPPPPPAS